MLFYLKLFIYLKLESEEIWMDTNINICKTFCGKFNVISFLCRDCSAGINLHRQNIFLCWFVVANILQPICRNNSSHQGLSLNLSVHLFLQIACRMSAEPILQRFFTLWFKPNFSCKFISANSLQEVCRINSAEYFHIEVQSLNISADIFLQTYCRLSTEIIL